MPLRMFRENTGWELARRELRFTATALGASEVHRALAEPLRTLLGEWNTLEQQRRDADDAVVDANALVQARDAQLDDQVQQLATRLRFEEGGHDGALFHRFFPRPPSLVVRLGLEHEIERTAKFAVVEAELPVSPAVHAILAAIVVTQQLGREALAARVQAVANAARVSLRLSTWKENANAARRSVDNLLGRYALDHGLPRDYADTWFPPTAHRSRAAEADAADDPPSAAVAAATA